MTVRDMPHPLQASEDSLSMTQKSLQREGKEGAPSSSEGVLVLGSFLKEMQKDMDEKMDVLINIQKNNKL